MEKRLSICKDDCKNCPITSCNFNPRFNMGVFLEGHKKASPVPLESCSSAQAEERDALCLEGHQGTVA